MTPLGRFLLAAFALGLGAQLAGLWAGDSSAQSGWLRLAMWTPALAALTSRESRKAARAALSSSGGRYLALALVVGWSLTLVKALLLAVSGGGAWNHEAFTLASDGEGIEAVRGLGMALGVGPQTFGFFALNLLVSLSLGSVLGGLMGGIGEEIGWRGVLQPELERRRGPLLGALMVGLLWSYWHLPANLGGLNDTTHPLLNALVLFPFPVVAMAFSFGWLTRKSGSVWPAALAHGANNTINAGFLVKASAWEWDVAADLGAALIVGGFFVALAAREARRTGAARVGDGGDSVLSPV